MHRHLAVLALLAPFAAAQSYLYLPASTAPNLVEGGSYNLRPFMQTNSRVQMFFDATEVGTSTFVAQAISLRYDGPIPQVGAPGPFTVQRLRVHVGSTAVAQPGASFAQNLSAPLTTVYDGTFTYLPDPGFGFPHPWEVPNTSMRIPFAAPVSIAIPAGGMFVVDVQMEGNNIANFGFSHAIVDGHMSSGGVTDGFASSFGAGCPAAIGGAPATMTTTGVHAPGAAHFISGQNLGPNTLALGLIGASNAASPFGALPFNLPSTACTLYTDAAISFLMLTDGAGAIAPNLQSGAVAVPIDPAFAGVQLFEQIASIAPNANAFGFVLSDARDITLGSYAPPTIGVYSVSHGADAEAGIADKVEPFGYALRVELN